MPRSGERNPPKVIAGDPEDTQGFPLLVSEYCEWLAVRGYAPGTIHGHRGSLAWLAGWLAERGVLRPSEVTKPMIDAYQRALYSAARRTVSLCRSGRSTGAWCRCGSSFAG